MDWNALKDLAADSSGLSKDALHIVAGVAGQLLVAAVLRRSVASPWPWLAVLAGELANEYYDLHREIWTDKPMWPESLKDVLVTMAVPTLLLIAARYAPSLLQSSPRARKRP